jgi:hypothetical protein
MYLGSPGLGKSDICETPQAAFCVFCDPALGLGEDAVALCPLRAAEGGICAFCGPALGLGEDGWFGAFSEPPKAASVQSVILPCLSQDGRTPA